MVSYLMRKGIPIVRCEGWSDYNDELPGGVARSRSLRIEIFDLRKLGKWLPKYRGSNFPLPVQWPDTKYLPLIKRIPIAKWFAFKLGLKIMRMKLTGAKLVSMGSALQARMLLKVLDAGADVRVSTPVVDFVRSASGHIEGAIEQGPFYAVEVFPGDVGTGGGVVIDEKPACWTRAARRFRVSTPPATARPRSSAAAIRARGPASALRSPSATSPPITPCARTRPPE